MLRTSANSPGAVPRLPQDFTNLPSLSNLAMRALPAPSATKILPAASHATSVRSEERRVGKECRSRGEAHYYKKKVMLELVQPCIKTFPNSLGATLQAP